MIPSEFISYLQLKTELDPLEMDRILSFASIKQLSRNELLLCQGDICKHRHFVLNGLLRVFSLTPDGNEHIIKFSNEGSWTMDKESYDLQRPAQTSISAVEASRVLIWTKPDFEKLNDTIPALQRFLVQLTADNVYLKSKRLLSTLSNTPEERYRQFIEDQPGLFARLPLKMIASYLGISLRTLDRIRQAHSANF